LGVILVEVNVKQLSLRGVFLIFGFLGAFCLSALAQEATIVGTVTDPSNAAVPNVAIKITNTDTNQVRNITTNQAGEYVAPDLHIGHYVIRAEASGFKMAEQTDIALAVGDRRRVDFKLELGSTQQSITVEATPVAVQSDTGEVSAVITGLQVAQLATNGRSVYTLAVLTPGASSNMPAFQAPTAVGANSNLSFNGMRQNHNLWLADGGEQSDRGGAGGLIIMPSIDSIAEFRVMTSNYSAEYGLSSAGTMNIIFKSGTKQLHASAWEFVRNDVFDAGNFLTNAAGGKMPKLRYNNWGFNVGGPVVLPGYNKNRDKTFFFYNMEWRRLINGAVISQVVPDPSTYGGNFGSTTINVPTAPVLGTSVEAAIAAGTLTPGQPFPNNSVAAYLDPNAQLLLAQGIFPARTSGNKYVGSADVPTSVREDLLRIDHHFSEKLAIFGHWVDDQGTQSYATSLWSGVNVPTVGTAFGNPSYSAVVHATHTISPTLLNEIAFNYDGNRINIIPTGIISQPSGLNIPRLFPGPNTDNRNPGIALQGATGSNYDVNWQPWRNVCDDYQIRDDFSWVKGSHQLRLGASWALYKKVQDLFGNTQGVFRFNGNYTGNDFADFLLGFANSYNELGVQDHGYWNATSWAAYVQDNWRATRRLTLNLGLRWDGVPHTIEANNRGSNFYPNLWNPANAAVLTPSGTIDTTLTPAAAFGSSPNPILKDVTFYLNGIGLAGKNGIPAGMVQNHWAAFGPRIGFAYDLTGSGKTVVRGGFGAMYERMQGNDLYNSGPNAPFSASVDFNNISLSNPDLSLLTGTALVAPVTVGSITGFADTDYKLPVSYQFSAGVQRQLGRDSILSVAYVGNQNRHQNDYRETNLPAPSDLPALINGTVAYNSVVPYLGWHSLRMSEMAENSHYNGLQVELKSRIKNDLTLQVAYTLSRSIDPAMSFGGDNTNTDNPYDRNYDMGPSLVDRTHIGLVSFIYDIPAFRNAPNHAVKTLAGGWQLSGIGTMQTGFPLNITLGGSQGSNGVANATNRPDLVGTITYPKTREAWFSKAALAVPTIGEWGNLGKGAIRGPGGMNWNISLFKNFVISESRGSGVEFRFETFNTFNHTQFNTISSSYSAGDFGAVNGVMDARVLQFAIKLKF
jgi:hypothetical protein